MRRMSIEEYNTVIAHLRDLGDVDFYTAAPVLAIARYLGGNSDDVRREMFRHVMTRTRNLDEAKVIGIGKHEGE